MGNLVGLGRAFNLNLDPVFSFCWCYRPALGHGQS